MALTEVSNKPEKSDKKTPEVQKSSEKKEKPLTKVIIRRLPPNIDQETFLNQISPVPDYDYLYLVKGDASLGDNSFSRAYINFVNPEDVYDFKEKFDNYVFIDSRGHEYPAVVEFASFQKIPKKRNKTRVDPKCASIETDPIYLEFVESLNKPQELEKSDYTFQITNENVSVKKQDTTTPLLEYVKNKRAERLRIREERREERKRKEFERKKIRDDERRKPTKPVVVKAQTSKAAKENQTETDTEKSEKEVQEKPPREFHKTYEKSSSSYYKNRERKFLDGRKDKPKFSSNDYYEKREFKSRRDDYKDRDYRKDYNNKHDDYKRPAESKVFTKKVKKYSERREERKIEAQKAEQKKEEEHKATDSNVTVETKVNKDSEQGTAREEQINDSKNKSETVLSDSKSHEYFKNKDSEKRIRNKDRPTLAIYRPGMLSKRKQNDGESDSKDSKKD